MPYALSDSLTMLRRNLRHLARNPSGVLFVIGFPLTFMLLFRIRFRRHAGRRPWRAGGRRPR